ncbi:MAG: trypsin-like serine protease, partial [Deltaproteobacteria bacterium]|nr:trypsin-like serine protease [Deltaproteobacteria bacterium]
MLRSSASCAVGALFLIAIGCGIDQPAELPGATNRPIIGGVAPDQPHHDSVVSLHYGGQSGIFCSGTLIADDVVLTAAHCLDISNGGPNFRT